MASGTHHLMLVLYRNHVCYRLKYSFLTSLSPTVKVYTFNIIVLKWRSSEPSRSRRGRRGWGEALGIDRGGKVRKGQGTDVRNPGHEEPVSVAKKCNRQNEDQRPVEE